MIRGKERGRTKVAFHFPRFCGTMASVAPRAKLGRLGRAVPSALRSPPFEVNGTSRPQSWPRNEAWNRLEAGVSL